MMFGISLYTLLLFVPPPTIVGLKRYMYVESAERAKPYIFHELLYKYFLISWDICC